MRVFSGTSSGAVATAQSKQAAIAKREKRTWLIIKINYKDRKVFLLLSISLVGFPGI